MEQTLNPIVKGNYKNFELKTKHKLGIKGIEPNNFVVVEKVYAEGQQRVSGHLKDRKGQPLVSYSCTVIHNGAQGSFFLNEDEHERFAACGGVGDKVKITLQKETYVNKQTGAEGLKQVLTFEKVD